MKIQDIELQMEHIGKKVLFVPPHAERNIHHKDCEIGIITSFNHQFVFVTYGPDRWKNCSKGTYPQHLLWADASIKV